MQSSLNTVRTDELKNSAATQNKWLVNIGLTHFSNNFSLGIFDV